MTAAKHTPGPWLNGRDATGMRIVFQDATDPGLPADAVNPEWQANLRLLDAAPDLLEALQHAVRWFDQLKPEDIARYRIAIAKATGGAQ